MRRTLAGSSPRAAASGPERRVLGVVDLHHAGALANECVHGPDEVGPAGRERLEVLARGQLASFGDEVFEVVAAGRHALEAIERGVPLEGVDDAFDHRGMSRAAVEESVDEARRLLEEGLESATIREHPLEDGHRLARLHLGPRPPELDGERVQPGPSAGLRGRHQLA